MLRTYVHFGNYVGGCVSHAVLSRCKRNRIYVRIYVRTLSAPYGWLSFRLAQRKNNETQRDRHHYDASPHKDMTRKTQLKQTRSHFGLGYESIWAQASLAYETLKVTGQLLYTYHVEIFYSRDNEIGPTRYSLFRCY